MNKHQARHYCTLTVYAVLLLVGCIGNPKGWSALYHILLFSAALWLFARVILFTSDRE